MNKKSRLGKGLSALINTSTYNKGNTDFSHNFSMLHINSIDPNPNQPRKTFDPELIKELSDSINQKGILQPIVVYKNKSTQRYTIISGERRFRAANIAKITEIPTIILDNISDKEAYELAMIENLQRNDLNIIEEIEGYQHLIDQHKYTQEELSKTLSKSRSHISNLLRLNKLPFSIKEKLQNGIISTGHARALITCKNSEKLLEIIIEKELSVRQTEELVKKHALGKPDKKRNIVNKKNAGDELQDIFTNIGDELGIKATISHNNNKGNVTLNFKNLKELDLIISKLS